MTKRRLGLVLGHPDGENEERHEQDPAADPEQAGEDAGGCPHADQGDEQRDRAQRPTTMKAATTSRKIPNASLSLRSSARASSVVPACAPTISSCTARSWR